jgi:hypothetical protein
MLAAALIFIVLPLALIALATRIRPLVPPDGTRGDAPGGMRAATGLFGGHGLAPDERVVPEETAPVRLNLAVVTRRK